jgi:predicted RNA-binding protein with RPS1 domain
VVDVGQEVNVEVLEVDLDRERVSLSLKATQEDPWRQFAKTHEVGDIIESRVTKLVPFGAFVEVDDAIEGLVHISELAEHHVEKAEDEVSVHDRVPVKIIDIDLDRRRISLSRKQAVRESAPGMDAMASGEMELEPEMEVEARAASEAVGVPTEDTSQRPEGEEEIVSAAETAPEIAEEPLAPEAITNADDAGQAAPPEEKEEAELISHAAPDSPPEGREGVTAAEPDTRNQAERLLQEEPDPGAAPGETIDELTAEQAPEVEAEGAETGTESLEPTDEGEEESIESIVQDLKRERGQS